MEPTRLGTAECRAHAGPWWGYELNPSNKTNGKPRESPRSQILWWPETGYNIWIRNWLELSTLRRTRLALNVGGISQWAGSGKLRRLGQPKFVLCFLAAPSSCCYSALPSQVTGTSKVVILNQDCFSGNRLCCSVRVTGGWWVWWWGWALQQHRLLP